MTLTNKDIDILINLINHELDGFCGDIGYMELTALRKKLLELKSPEPET